MVLYKRKPIMLPDPRPLPTDLNIYVWHIDETGEWFITYEEYLERLDFYTRHHFTCEITGTSCLTFFQALDSEETEFRYVEERFPLKLREPVARFLHFNGIKRLDALVEQVYARFKSDFFPGEIVYLRKNNRDLSATPSQPSPQPDEGISKENGDSMHVHYQKPYIIKEKAQFNASKDPNTGEVITPAHSKYMLIEETQNSKSLIADQSQLYRDRTTFTKHLIKCFCKITLRRASSKMGAPWAVKEEYLPMYGLTMDWPPEMLKYKDEEPVVKQDAPKSKRKREDEVENLQGEQEENKRTEEEEAIKHEKEASIKRKKTAEEEKEDSVVQENTVQVNVITSIVEDLVLPYQGPPHVFENLCHYNNLLESVPVSNNNLPFKPFRETQKLLQVFQFLCTFAPKMCLSYFNLDQLITSLKCTDPSELKGEVVYVELLNEHGESSFTENESDWQRNPKIREFIKHRNTERVRHYIAKDDPASDEIIDNINHNGCGLLVECISALLRLFINEDGDWTSLVMEEWLENNDIGGRENSKSDKQNDSNEDGEEEANEFGEINDTLEKCLSYRNVNWAERLSKRQFNNHYWTVILLGIFQDCMHIPLYTDIIRVLVEKLVPSDISATQLPKQLWRNFCFQLSLEEKLNCIWILVDLLSNFSADIKTAVEESMDLCGQIRSERFRFSKDLKAEASYLNLLNLDLQTLEQAGTRDEPAIESHKARIAVQADKLEQLQKDKNFLDKKLMENDLQRLRALGLDRYGNRYYWMDLCGVPLDNMENTENLSYHSGRLWIQGPAADAAKFFLQISGDELNQWKKLAEEYGKAHATKEVFHVYKTPEGSYRYVEGGNEVEICDCNGIVNSLIELNSIQKKIIDETPECLLLSEDQWYSVDRIENVRRLIDWFDNWGRREHDLLKQFKTIEDTLDTVYSIRDKVLHLFVYDGEEEELFKELREYEFTKEELDFDAPTKEENNNSNGNNDDPENSEKGNEEQEEQEEQEEKADDEQDEEELEAIAGKIMKLDDSSKTRKILNSIKELEDRRDELLTKRRNATTIDGNTENPSGGKAQARTKRKRLRNLRNNKLNKQAEILTDLLNHRHFVAMEDTIGWKNQLSTKVLGTALRKNASGKQKIKTVETVDAKLKEIMDQTSRTTVAATNN
ncbi:hypothetical protein ZYGM_000669 [Zygosaccharomyces mellis]|uniref:Itc1p n=1 Tax=Zygosaccharomyces mellis TaxID=42258 RepID=A0A4C2E8V3_9SACH|nr:hypothetical protein ZYGM_000669 [Zygosaccharomyces mellis]